MSQLEHGDALGASYRLTAPIGSGAAGDVWAVEPSGGGAHLAAKILQAEHVNDPALVERFVRERSVLLDLRHENIVRVRDLVVEGSTLAIVMELLPGGSVRELLDANGPLAPSTALHICAQTLRALAVAHRKDITHRDIKPDNVLLTEPWSPSEPSTTVRVTDFGIASVIGEKNRQTTGLIGTPQYMAPELISHGRSTPAGDVYSTGIMLYELLAGRTPFAGPGTEFTVAYRHVTTAPPELDVPSSLWALLTSLLDKDPRKRPSSADAAAMLTSLAQEVSDAPPLAPAAVPPTFSELERPHTMIRSDLMRRPEAPPEYRSELSHETPLLGETEQLTMLRPMPSRHPDPLPAPSGATDATDVRGRFTRKSLLLGATGLVLLLGLGVGLVALFGGGEAQAQEAAKNPVQATQQDAVLPTGLTTSRTAEFDPDTGEIELEVTFVAQKAPLTGPFLQAVPGTTSHACPAVTWDGVSGARHRPSMTGLPVECGWQLDGIRVPANGRATVTARFSGTVADADALSTWLGRAASLTSDAITDPEIVSTAYPVQRVQNVVVSVPPRAVSQTPLAVSVLPVWPSGTDALNPLFTSPTTGEPSRMLQQIAGDDPVQLADACSGAVAVAPDGFTVTALSVTRDCRLRASVGNFTSLESTPFSITTRE